MNARNEFGIRLRELRKGRGLSQEKLAGEISRSVDALSKLERGLSLPSFETILSLSKVLATPLGDLLEPFDQSARISSNKRSLQSQVMAICQDLDEAKLAIAVKQLKALKDGLVGHE
ncbi:MAG: helix-turn-helix transcriptional regulator [Rhodospirillaceae bacterium]